MTILQVKLMGVDFFPEGLSADAEDLGGLRAAALGKLQNLDDVRGQISQTDGLLARKSHAPLDDIE